MPQLNQILEGNKAALCSYVDDRDIDTIESFINDLSGKDQKKIIALFDLFCELGVIVNKEKFNRLGNKLFEFKSGSIRIICFFLPNANIKTAVLVNCFFKQKSKTPKKELEKARARMNEILELQKNDSLIIIGINDEE